MMTALRELITTTPEWFPFMAGYARRPASSRSYDAACARSGMFFVLGGTYALSEGILLAHIGAFLRVSEVLVSAEVIDSRTQVRPHDRIAGAMCLGQGCARKLISAGCGRCRRCWCGNPHRGRTLRCWSCS